MENNVAIGEVMKLLPLRAEAKYASKVQGLLTDVRLNYEYACKARRALRLSGVKRTCLIYSFKYSMTVAIIKAVTETPPIINTDFSLCI